MTRLSFLPLENNIFPNNKQTNMRICKENEILNPKTNRCVQKSGKIGKKLLASVHKTKQKNIFDEKETILNDYKISKSKRKR
jgi:hypothetical protein